MLGGKKKKLTKLLKESNRKRILESIGAKKIADMKIVQYARYMADTQIMTRSHAHENDKDAGYGFSPINVLCAVMKDGSISTKLVEFGVVNHFLKEKDGDAAVEVIACILVEWAKSNRDIASFEVDTIDKKMKEIESQYVAEQKAKRTNDNEDGEKTSDADGRKVEEMAEPIS